MSSVGFSIIPVNLSSPCLVVVMIDCKKSSTARCREKEGEDDIHPIAAVTSE
jgi:hypothetical protein